MANENLHDFDKLRDEEDEGEDDESEKGVTDNFAGYVAVKETHGRKEECNMGETKVAEGQGVGEVHGDDLVVIEC
ncbi:MAG TPA: hypothetical protein VK703_01530 [Candidatus Acidoferrales bacterium]|jgi:hypothetical protein|nr:hypothetical protein [Candidatus Acidoferrales bacterium]